MKKLLCLFLICSSSWILSQEEYLMHLESLRKITHKPDPDCLITDSTFIDYALKNIIPENEQIYISNRFLLHQLKTTSCRADHVLIEGTDYQKRKIEIDIQIKPGFIKEESYIPAEILKLNIVYNRKTLVIPDSIFGDFKDPLVCKSLLSFEPISAYSSLYGKYIYIYFLSGLAADSQFVKLIFDNERFITKWSIDYDVILCFDALRHAFTAF